MAVNNSFYSTINGLVSQIEGAAVPAVVDYASFVDAGRAITALSGSDLANGFVAALMNKIAVSINTFRGYRGKLADLDRGYLANGNTIEMVMHHFYTAQAAAFPTLTNGVSVDQYVVNKPDVEAYYYIDTNAFTIPITIQYAELKKAWASPGAMDSFISGVIGSVVNSKEKARETGRLGMLCKAIDDSTADTNAKNVTTQYIGQPGTAYHLVTMYNATYNPSPALTAADALQTPQFIKFATMVINNVMEQTAEVSTEFNIAGLESFSRPEDRKLYVASLFYAASAANVYSDIYHPDYNMLGEHVTIAAWQNLNDPLTIKVSGTPDRTQVCLACIADYWAVGEWVTTQDLDITPYNARGKYWNEFYNMETRYVINHAANFVSFLLD